MILLIYGDPRFRIICDHKDFKRHLNTCHVLPLWQISAKTSSLEVHTFRRVNFAIAISETALVARIYRDFSVPSVP